MSRSIGPIAAMLAALLFGASTPLAKLLVGQASPWTLAGLLYLGSGLGLGLLRLAGQCRRRPAAAPERPRERSLRGDEWLWLAAAVAAGGVAGPVLLMTGLTLTTAADASLLLNLEGVLTALLAWLVFHEGLDRRLLTGMAAILAGAILLSLPGGDSGPAAGGTAGLWGPLAIAAACLAWAVDNNLTRKVALANPTDIALIKGLAAGSVNLAIGLALGGRPPAEVTPAALAPPDGTMSGMLPTGPVLAAALALGLAGYGISLVLYIIALRHIGTARTGAYFSTAPFVGSLLAVALFHEPPTLRLAAAAALMATGVWLHLTEDHDHEHSHEAVEHDHPHHHDQHHGHPHDSPPAEPHSHPHRHAPVRHSHRHYPDAHHSHRH